MKSFKGSKMAKLFFAFFKIGLFTIGGGYAMIPFIQREIVEENKWMESDEIMDIFAIAEATPGVVAVNSATFVGCRVAGFWGALVATAGVSLPAFFIILLISGFFLQFKENIFVSYAFEGVRASVIILIVFAVIKLSRHCEKSAFTILSGVLAFLIASFTKFSVIYLILASFLIGIAHQILLPEFKSRNGGK